MINSVTVLKNIFNAWALMKFPVDTDLSQLKFETMASSIHMPRFRKIKFYVGSEKIFSCITEQLENPFVGKYQVDYFFKPIDLKFMSLEDIQTLLKRSIAESTK